MSDEMIESIGYSAPVSIPAGTFKLNAPWSGWGLSDHFHPSLSAGYVRVTRGQLIRIIDEMAKEIERLSPGTYDFTRAREAVQAYQKDCVFEVGKPNGKKMTGRVKSMNEVPESGGEWITFELHPLEGE